MEKLPQRIENKIFYYLIHPIANLLKRQQIVLLKSKYFTKFSSDYFNATTVLFSPEKIGIIGINEKGLYRLGRIKFPHFRIFDAEEIVFDEFFDEPQSVITPAIVKFENRSDIEFHLLSDKFNDGRSCAAGQVFFTYRSIRKCLNDKLMEKNKCEIGRMLRHFYIGTSYDNHYFGYLNERYVPGNMIHSDVVFRFCKSENSEIHLYYTGRGKTLKDKISLIEIRMKYII
jgi:hypothetical protein